MGASAGRRPGTWWRTWGNLAAGRRAGAGGQRVGWSPHSAVPLRTYDEKVWEVEHLAPPTRQRMRLSQAPKVGAGAQRGEGCRCCLTTRLARQVRWCAQPQHALIAAQRKYKHRCSYQTKQRGQDGADGAFVVAAKRRPARKTQGAAAAFSPTTCSALTARVTMPDHASLFKIHALCHALSTTRPDTGAPAGNVLCSSFDGSPASRASCLAARRRKLHPACALQPCIPSVLSGHPSSSPHPDLGPPEVDDSIRKSCPLLTPSTEAKHSFVRGSARESACTPRGNCFELAQAGRVQNCCSNNSTAVPRVFRLCNWTYDLTEKSSPGPQSSSA